MEIRIERHDNIDVVQLSGRLDMVSSSALKDRMHQALQDGRLAFVLDCRALDFINSSGLGRLLSVFKDVRLAGGQLVLCSLTPFVDEVMRLTCLDRVFDLHHDRETAMAILSAAAPIPAVKSERG